MKKRSPRNPFRRSLFSLALIIAGGRMSLPPQPVEAARPSSRKEAGRLARFERQVEQLRQLLKISGCELPDPNWAAGAEGFSEELARLKQRAGGYSYEVEAASHKAIRKWLADRRQQARTAVKVDPATFDAYAGRYQGPDGTVFNVTRERDRLMVDIQDYAKAELFASAGAKFFLKVLDGDWSFVRNEAGEVTHVEVVQGGQPFILKRLK